MDAALNHCSIVLSLQLFTRIKFWKAVVCWLLRKSSAFAWAAWNYCPYKKWTFSTALLVGLLLKGSLCSFSILCTITLKLIRHLFVMITENDMSCIWAQWNNRFVCLFAYFLFFSLWLYLLLLPCFFAYILESGRQNSEPSGDMPVFGFVMQRTFGQ